MYGLRAVLRGLLKWTKSCFFIISALISSLTLKKMPPDGVSHGRGVLFSKTAMLRVQRGRGFFSILLTSNEEINCKRDF